MRRTASEILSDLEIRIARLEKSSASDGCGVYFHIDNPKARKVDIIHARDWSEARDMIKELGGLGKLMEKNPNSRNATRTFSVEGREYDEVIFDLRKMGENIAEKELGLKPH